MSGLATAVNLDFGDAIDEFDLLLTKTNEAGDEVPTSVAEMLDNLQQEANNFAEFEAGLVVLKALGLDTLAADIAKDGIKAKGALDLFLKDLPGAEEADRILREGGNPGQEYVDLVLEAIENGNVTPALLDFVKGFTSQEVKEDVLNAALALSGVFGTAFQNALNELDISLPANVIAANITGIGSAAQLPQASTVGGQTVYNNTYNFENTPNPDTATARIQQTQSAVQTLGRE
jgi:hypothetical protein